MIKTKFSLIALALLAMAGQSFAASQTANFQVAATVTASCVVTASNIAFGSITPAATGEATATGTITSTCSKSVPFTLKISAGSSNDAAARKMAGTDGTNTDKLAYALYTDAGKTSIWGDGVAAGTSTVPLVGTGEAQTSTVYGALSLNQYLKPDTYVDNLTVTLEY